MPSDLWRNRSYVSVWSAATISNFGSMIFAIALPLAAVTRLDASPADIAAIHVAQTLPGALLGWVASAWIDRLPRLPLLRRSDVLRALLLGGLALSAATGRLAMWQLVAVAFGLGLLGFVFHVAQHSLLPSIVERSRLVEANAKLRVADSVTEGLGFAGAGFLMQGLGAPLAFAVDAGSYLLSALCLSGVEEPPAPERPPSEGPPSLRREVAEGLRAVSGHPLLVPLALAQACMHLGIRLIGVVYMIFAVQTLGIPGSWIGIVAATGAISSVAGAGLAQRTGRRWRPGRALITGIVVLGAASLAIPAAAHAGALALTLLFVHQLGDGGWVLYEIHATSLRQQAVSGRLQGRVNGFFGVLDAGAALLGSVLGGLLGEWLGLERTLWLGAALILVAAALLAGSRVREHGRPAAAPASG